jgi:Protein of unknown function (DUF2911)
MRWLAASCFSICLMFTSGGAVAQAAISKAHEAACSFDDGRQISVRYYSRELVSERKTLPSDAVWTPGGSPIILFTQAPLSVAGSEVPVGAYSMYLIPGKTQWTLILNTNVNAIAKYDQQQDILRAPMQVGSLSQPTDEVQIVAHVSPKQCSMRMYREGTGAWVGFKEK